MALYNTDKTTVNSVNPTPVRHDTVIQDAVMARGTNSVNYATGASATGSLAAGKNGQFTIIASGTWDGSSTSFTTIDPGAGNFIHDIQALAQIPYNFGFTPAYLAFVKEPGTGIYVPMPYMYYQSTSSTGLWMNLHLVTTPTELIIVASYMLYGGPFTVSFSPVKYYLMQQTAN